MEIGKLLTIYHGKYDTIKLDKSTTFYPCKQILISKISGRKHFTVLAKFYTRDVH